MDMEALIADAWAKERDRYIIMDHASECRVLEEDRDGVWVPVFIREDMDLCQAHVDRLCADAVLSAIREAGRVVVPAPAAAISPTPVKVVRAGPHVSVLYRENSTNPEPDAAAGNQGNGE